MMTVNRAAKTQVIFNGVAKVANIATTNLVTVGTNTAIAGMYRVTIALEVTTAVAASTITVTLGWTDRVGATTATPINVFTSAVTGRTSGTQILWLNSGSLTYATTLAVGLPTYNITIRAEAL